MDIKVNLTIDSLSTFQDLLADGMTQKEYETDVRFTAEEHGITIEEFIYDEKLDLVEAFVRAPSREAILAWMVDTSPELSDDEAEDLLAQAMGE